MAQRVFDFAAASGNRAIQAQSLTSAGQPRRRRRQPAAGRRASRRRGQAAARARRPRDVAIRLTNLAELLIRLGRRPEAEPCSARSTPASPRRPARSRPGCGASPTASACRAGRPAVRRRPPVRARRRARGARSHRRDRAARPGGAAVAEARLGTRRARREVRPGVDPKSAAGSRSGRGAPRRSWPETRADQAERRGRGVA